MDQNQIHEIRRIVKELDEDLDRVEQELRWQKAVLERLMGILEKQQAAVGDMKAIFTSHQ